MAKVCSGAPPPWTVKGTWRQMWAGHHLTVLRLSLTIPQVCLPCSQPTKFFKEATLNTALHFKKSQKLKTCPWHNERDDFTRHREFISHHAEQWPTGPWPVFVKKGLLAHSHTRSLMYYLQLLPATTELSCHDGDSMAHKVKNISNKAL